MGQADPAVRILRAASRLLSEEGPDALTNRRIAEEAACTTMSIYSRYGSKGGVLEALFDEGLGRLEEAQRTVEPALEPLDAIVASCGAFRRAALDNPGHYWLIFGPPPKGFRPSAAVRERARRSFGWMERGVVRAIEVRAIDGEPAIIAYDLLAACHGHVTLALLASGRSGLSLIDGDLERAYVAAVRRGLSSYAVTA